LPISPEEDAAITAAAATDPDNPILDDETLSRMRPVREVAPELIEMARKRGRPPVARPKVPIKIRLSADVLERFRATGAGWQTRIDETLRKAIETADVVERK
jgi:uncharacterized protein (DUF4415 family)